MLAFVIRPSELILITKSQCLSISISGTQDESKLANRRFKFDPIP